MNARKYYNAIVRSSTSPARHSQRPRRGYDAPEKKQMFEIDDAERQNVKVQF
jgi:hypothetical protein